MQEIFTTYIRKEQLFHAADRVLLAVSGGIDSVVMARLFHDSGLNFSIAHINHGLRGTVSDDEEKFVADLAKHYNVPFYVHRITALKKQLAKDESVQSGARRLRYAFLRETVTQAGYSCIATAHHLDDNLETVLLNLVRNTGLSGLRGMLPKQGGIVRPLLPFTRSTIEQFAAAHQLDWCHDSSNDSDAYARNRIRHHVVPGLKTVNAGLEKSFAETLHHLRDAEVIYLRAIETERNRLMHVTGESAWIDAGGLTQLPAAATFLYEFIRPYGFNATHAQDIVQNLLHGQSGASFVSDTHQVFRDRSRLFIVPLGMAETEELRFTPGETVAGIETEFIAAPFSLPPVADPGTAYFDAAQLQYPLLLRNWKQGDRLVPLGMQQSKKISDLLVDAKVPLHEKDKVRVLVSGDTLIWLVGHRISEQVKVTDKTAQVLRITMKPQP